MQQDEQPVTDEETPDTQEVVEESALDEGDQSDKQEEADTSTEADGHTEEKPKGGFQKRVDRLTARAKTAESERDYWKNLAQQQKEDVAKPTPPKLPDPSLKDYNPEEYAKQEAKFYEDMEAFNQSSYKYTQHQTKAEAEEAENKDIEAELAEDWGARVSEVSQKIPDWEKVVTSEKNPVSKAMADVAMRSDKGPEVLYELAKNPEQARRIYNMNPIQTAYEMGKIESRLAVKPKTTSKAPDPVSTLSSSGESANMSSDDMSIDEYMKEQKRKRLAQFS